MKKWFLIKQIDSAHGVQVTGWSIDQDILEDARCSMINPDEYKVVSEDKLLELVTEFV